MEQNTKVLTSEIINRIITADDLLNVYNISLEDWEIEKQVLNTWEVGAKGPDNKIVTTPLFQVKVWLKNKNTSVFKLIREDFIEDIKKLSPKVDKISYKPRVDKTPLLLEINIFYLHLGKIAWDEETGQNYNLDIASGLFNNCIDDFIAECQNKNIEKIVLPIGNDFFNSDRSHPFNSTTRGTPQEEDARWQKTFRTGRQLIVDNIIKLSQIAPVDVVMVPGNHDYERNFYLGDSLEGWFYNNGLFNNVGIVGSPVTSPTGCLNLYFADGITITSDRNGGGGSFSYTMGSTITANQWHYLIYNRNADGTTAVYIDGVRCTATSTDTLNYNTATDTIGRYYGGYWPGYWTNMRMTIGTAVYNSNLTTQSIPRGPLTSLANTKYLMLGAVVTTDSSGTQTVTNNNGVTQTSVKPFTPPANPPF
jgi:hypothetical protein